MHVHDIHKAVALAEQRTELLKLANYIKSTQRMTVAGRHIPRELINLVRPALINEIDMQIIKVNGRLHDLGVVTAPRDAEQTLSSCFSKVVADPPWDFDEHLRGTPQGRPQPKFTGNASEAH
jgi:hypothetical protein